MRPRRRQRIGQAFDRVAGNRGANTAGVDGLTVAFVEEAVGVPGFLDGLRAQLKAGTFRPLPVRERKIPKPGGAGKVRKLGIPAIADRVVQAALKLVLEPIFEAGFLPVSYGFRPMRRPHDAIAEIQRYGTKGYWWVLDADIEACFDSISHTALMGRVRARVKDKRVLALVKAFLKAGVRTELGDREDSPTGTPMSDFLTQYGPPLQAPPGHRRWFLRPWFTVLIAFAAASVLGVAACGGGGAPATPAASHSTGPSPALTPAPQPGTHTAQPGEPALIAVPGYDYSNVSAADAAIAKGLVKSDPVHFKSGSEHNVLQAGTMIGGIILIQMRPKFANMPGVQRAMIPALAGALGGSGAKMRQETIQAENVLITSDGSQDIYIWYHGGALTIAGGNGSDFRDFVEAYLKTANA